jgi:hypothetical protein
VNGACRRTDRPERDRLPGGAGAGKLGVKPVAPPPVYPPELVADAILYAAQRPVRDIVVGGAAKALIVRQAVAARLLDGVLRWFGFRVHYTDDPKPADGPNNLFAPLAEHNAVSGSVRARARSRSRYTALEMRPSPRRTLPAAGGAVVTGLLLRGRPSRSIRKPSRSGALRGRRRD